MKQIGPGPQKSPNQLKSFFFYVLNNNFSYTQLSLAFFPQKGSYYVHNDTDFFFFLFLERFWYLSRAFLHLFFSSERF